MFARPQDRSRADPRASADRSRADPRVSAPIQPLSSGRYTIYGQIGAGGMATVQYAHFVGPGGFSRPVAIKRLHPHFANDPGFASAFLDEARISARIAHANVVATLDVLAQAGEISVVMEYVHGESLAGLFGLAHTRGTLVPYKIATSLLVGVLHGLQAAHETCSEHGEPLGMVHRDVSPENILVGSDGIARLLDFGIAKAKGRSRTTPTGELKGKLGYMAPEQYQGEDVDRRVDVYGASVVLWEALTGQVLFDGANDAAVVNAVMNGVVRAPSELVPALPKALDMLVLRGLARNRDNRFESAREMALALERDVGVATQSEVSDWLHNVAGTLLQERAAALGQLRQRREEHHTQEASELGTRRLAIDLAASVDGSRASGRASTPTRAQPLDGETATLTGRSSESGLRARKTARPGRWALLLLACLAAGIWLASALEPPPMPATPDGSRAPGRAATRRELERGTAEPHGQQPDSQAVGSERAPDLATAGPALPGTARAPEGALPVTARAPEGALRPAPAAQPEATSEQGAARSSEISRLRPEREKLKHEGRSKQSAKARDEGARRKADCTQPYVVDALGIRRWKRECL
jgi:serine/threonine protein kinase